MLRKHLQQHRSLVARTGVGALAHLAALLLQPARPLLIPFPPEHRARLLVRVGLVRHRREAGPQRTEPAPPRWLGLERPRAADRRRRMKRPTVGGCQRCTGPRCPQLFAPFWRPWGPLGLVRGALDAVGASLELLGTPWARDTFSNNRLSSAARTPRPHGAGEPKDGLEEEGGDVEEEPAGLVQEECVYVKSVLYVSEKV